MLLVTGITGHSGRYFLDELIKHNYEGRIRCVVRETSDTTSLDNSGLRIEKFEGDLSNNSLFNEAMIGVNTVMHIYNIHHSPMIVKAAIENNVSRVILVHTTGVYSQFKNASQEYKNIEKEITKLIENSTGKTEVTILRPTMIYGDLCDANMSKFIKLVDKFTVMPIIDKGNSLIQPVNARDLGAAYYEVLVSPEKTSGKNYTLSGNQPIKMIEVFKLISKELNKKTVFISVPLKAGVLIASIVKILTLGKIDYIERVQRMGEDRSYSHKEARADFNYKPLSIDIGIRLEVKEYLEKQKV
ncbi:SDR family oxidoreductase [Bacillus sp. RAR_GA_16]|uniref:SDR family oxidoreductase n=1 Tax=Bacillus sp. RAR_GA_16 TaxID=2876774 RepID=UPI001CCAEC72|nr:NmrA family NAD(P)-binding protein [Bacillus sp. RAR_GA_16]MCA0170376.1 NAD(P)H-binding protein [Bacillus sp. RAR_GA_16]